MIKIGLITLFIFQDSIAQTKQILKLDSLQLLKGNLIHFIETNKIKFKEISD